MQAQIKYSYLDEYKILKTLGEGFHAQVKLGVDSNGNYVAIKKYKKETASLGTLLQQLAIMKNLNHQNIVKLIGVRENAMYKSRREVNYECFAIILQYVGGGQLFDYIAGTGKFSQQVTRTYFHQLMNALQYLHLKGYAHRDIKPENILFSSNFVLKVADFGFSCLIQGKDNSGILHTKLGTEGYMAPEIIKREYEGTKTDIFAAGVILFMMYSESPPFEKATPNDPYYKLIKQKSYNVFWNAHGRRKSKGYFSQAFKDIFVRMVAYEPSERPTIQEIAKHQWVSEKISTFEEIKQQFSKRQEKLDIIVKKKREEETLKKGQRMKEVQNNGIKTRGKTLHDTRFFQCYEEEVDNKRVLPDLRLLSKQDFIVNEELAYVIASLKSFFYQINLPLEQPTHQQQLGQGSPTILKLKFISDSNNKISFGFQYAYGPQCEQIQSVEASILLGLSDNGGIILRLKRQSGNQIYYKKILRQIQNHLSNCLI